MRTHLLHWNAILVWLLIGLAFCKASSVQRFRVKRDTRDIPSDKFKPLPGSSTISTSTPAQKQGSNSNVNSNSDLEQNYHENFEERSSAGSRVTQNSGSQEELSDVHFRPPTSRFSPSNRIFYPQSSQSSNFFVPNFGSSFEPNVGPFVGGRRIGSTNFGLPGSVSSIFRESSLNGPSYVTEPLSIHSGPRLPSGDGFFERNSPLLQSGSGGGSSNNFYRSEAFSHSADGMGAPRIEHNMFDSRLGHSISNRNF